MKLPDLLAYDDTKDVPTPLHLVAWCMEDLAEFGITNIEIYDRNDEEYRYAVGDFVKLADALGSDCPEQWKFVVRFTPVESIGDLKVFDTQGELVSYIQGLRDAVVRGLAIGEDGCDGE